MTQCHNTTHLMKAPQKGRLRHREARFAATQQAGAGTQAWCRLCRVHCRSPCRAQAVVPPLKDSSRSALQGILLEGGLGNEICQSCKSLKP